MHLLHPGRLATGDWPWRPSSSSSSSSSSRRHYYYTLHQLRSRHPERRTPAMCSDETDFPQCLTLHTPSHHRLSSQSFPFRSVRM